MNEPDIAPLARRLAEENNVDWRRLAGSGDGGRIVERDVLGFLARVMAGDEDVDPTPEPVPEGMQAWPEADVAAYRAAAAAPPAPPQERSVTSTLDDDLFLFDEPTAVAADVPAEVDDGGATEVVRVPDDEDGDDLLLVDEAPTTAPGGAVAAGAAPAADEDDVVFVTDDLEATAAPEAAADLPDLFEAGDDTQDAAAVVGMDDLAVEHVPSAHADAFGDERGAAVTLDDDLFEADDLGAAPAVDDALFVSEGGAAPVAADAEDALFVPEGEDAAAGDGRPAAAPPAPLAVDLAAADVRLVRHGQVWRRRVDDRAFRSAVSHVADALDAAPTAVATALLARAVARAWAGPVALDGWWWDGGARRHPVPTDGPVADAVAALLGADDAERVDGSAGLVVADLAAFGLDEAVLHLDAPLLALGRAAGDGAWLTLSGDEVAESAVTALGRVAEALAAPIRLLL